MSIKNKLKKIRVSDVIGACKLMATYPIGKVVKYFHEDIWLITERPDDARDNGYFLFKYIRENYPSQKVYYAINNKSYDFHKIKKLGNYIQFGSIKHYVYYWAAKYNISSQIGTGEPTDRICLNLEKLGIIKNTKIFLQHGITKDIVNFALYKNCKVNKFICGAKPEYEFVKKEFGYAEEDVKYLGLCRFDGLYDYKNNDKQILIMPTWRNWLDDKKMKSDFEKSKYFKRYISLLNNEKFIKFIETENINVIFYPHDNMQKYINLYKSISKNIIIANKEKYDVQKLLKESSLLITDYSSVYFDFAYMNKPVLYYQFDLDDYRDNQYKEGYFNYEENGFGEVLYDESKLIDLIIKKYKDKFTMSNIYIKRVKEFFTIQDRLNCKRTYEAIYEMNKEKKNG